jgi:hypothetical protein
MLSKNTSKEIKARHMVLNYELKEGTRASFYCQDNTSILPGRFSFIVYEGKGSRIAIYQLKAKYKQNEKGWYYEMNNRDVHTKIMPVSGYPNLIGWGEIDERFNRHDLLVLEYADEEHKKIRIHLFKGLAYPKYLQSVLEYLESL